MKCNSYRIVFLLIFLTTTLSAQNGQVSGIIQDIETKEPLLAANIAVDNAVFFSDYDGLFDFTLPYGEYEITVSYIGYDDKLVNITIDRDLADLVIELSPTTTLLQTATISGSKYERRLSDVPVSINVITPDTVSYTHLTLPTKRIV